jgi:hypothetical protein
VRAKKLGGIRIEIGVEQFSGRGNVNLAIFDTHVIAMNRKGSSGQEHEGKKRRSPIPG